MDGFEKSDGQPEKSSLNDHLADEKKDDYPTFEADFSYIARASRNALLRRLSESRQARRAAVSGAESLARLYVASPPTRGLCTLLCALVTLSLAMAAMFRGSQRAPWHHDCLTFAIAAAYIVISCVILLSHLFGQTLPTFTVVMFSGIGGMLHLVAGSDALQINKDFRLAALMSVTTGLQLLLDAAVTLLTMPWTQPHQIDLRTLEPLLAPREPALPKKRSFSTYHPRGPTETTAGSW